MLKIAARVIIGVVAGSLFVVAVAFSCAMDIIAGRSSDVRNGTTAASPESLRRVTFVDKART
jgi:hypothetical protein